MSDSQEPENDSPSIGRNEPCPCGSGKKYKRCCGKGAAPILGEPKAAGSLPPGAAEQFGVDPSQIDPGQMASVQKALSKLPRGQIQKLQSVMKKAMAGKDVTEEMAKLGQSLPPGFLETMQGLNLPGAPEVPSEGQETVSDMDESEARRLVENAVQKGELSKEDAAKILDGKNPEASSKKSLWSRIRGK